MEQAGKFLYRIVVLGALGAIAVAEGCSMQTKHGDSGVILGTFLLVIGVLLAVGAIVLMLVWAARSLRA